MFRDPDLFDLPIPPRMHGWLAARLSAWRARSARQLYASIGGKSPIGATTLLQAELLENALRPSLPCRVVVAMRYGSPNSADAIEAIREAKCDQVLLLPLYPQFCTATTGSSTREWHFRCAEEGLHLPTLQVESYHALPEYIEAVTERVREALERFPFGTWPHLVFSAHGVPQKFVAEGDPYKGQVEETVRLVRQKLAPNLGHSLCYQSRVGPQRWLRPSLTETLKRLAKAHTQSVLVIPISFVSDHLETLSEIDIEARELALSSGIERFETVRGLNDSPVFIAALAKLIRERAGETAAA